MTFSELCDSNYYRWGRAKPFIAIFTIAIITAMIATIKISIISIIVILIIITINTIAAVAVGGLAVVVVVVFVIVSIAIIHSRFSSNAAAVRLTSGSGRVSPAVSERLIITYFAVARQYSFVF